MSGLIWAGIGKGIADAGSAVGNSMFKAIDADLTEHRLLDREERRAKLKEEADERKAERDAQERMDIATKASERADKMARDRVEIPLGKDAATLAKSSAQADEQGDTALSEEQLKELLRNDPKLRESYKKSGLITGAIGDKVDPRLQRANDEEQAVRELGAKASFVEAYAKAKKDVLNQIAQENKDAQTNRRLDQTDARLEQMTEFQGRMAGAAEKRASAAETRANRPPAGSSASDKPATTADMQRQVTAAQNNLATELGVSKNDLNAEIKSIRKRADAGNAQAKSTLDRIQPMLDDYNDANRRMLDFKRNKSNSNDNSATPTQSGARNYNNLWN